MKEKIVQRLIDIPEYMFNKMNEICTNENISLNYFVNKAIDNNFNDNLSLINVSKRMDTESIRLRIKFDLYIKLKECTKEWNISMQKIIIHFILCELKRYKF